MSIIAAGNTTTTALVQTADTTGNLVFTTGGANTVALTLSNAQAATFVGSVSSLNTFGFKNRIINGAMVIDQRNAGASVTFNDGVYSVDRWRAYGSQTSKLTAQQLSSSPPAGFSYYMGITSSSAYSIGAGDYFGVGQNIEGFNFADFGFGTANAKTITLSFQVYSSLTGTFGGSLRNSAASRAYPFTYSIPTANTWTTISITVAGDTSGTWIGATNGTGVSLIFGLGVGTTYSATAGAWATGNYISATGATSVVGTNGATFYITGVQLEVGSQATSFDFRDYGRELILCQRYCEAFNGRGSGNRNLGVGGISINSGYGVPYKVTKRATPTISGTYAFQSVNCTGATYYVNDTDGVLLYATVTAAGSYDVYQLTGTAIFSAEL